MMFNISHGRYTKLVGDLIYKPPIHLGSHGTKNVQMVGSKVLNISHGRYV